MKLEVRSDFTEYKNICGINLQEAIIHFHKNGRQIS